MKEHCPLSILILSILVFLTSSCEFITGSQTHKKDKPAGLVLLFNKEEGRTLAPADMNITAYELVASGPKGHKLEKVTTGTWINLELVPGTWNIQVKGRTESNTVLAAGGTEVQLASGEHKTTTVQLLPMEGNGRLLLNWTISGDLGTDTLLAGELTPEKGLPAQGRTISVAANMETLELADLPGGSYKLGLALWKGENRICGMSEAVLIMADQLTQGTLSFDPPTAQLELILDIPNFLGESRMICPSTRYIATGKTAAFSVNTEMSGLPGSLFPGAWYLDGFLRVQSATEAILTAPSLGSYRIDWIGNTGGMAACSANARLVSKEENSLGSLSWMETLKKEALPAGAGEALDGCKDLCFSSSGDILAAVGENKKLVGFFDFRGTTSLFPFAALYEKDDPRLCKPSLLVNLTNSQYWALLSSSEGRVNLVELDIQNREASIISSMSSSQLVDTKDLAYDVVTNALFLASSSTNAVYRLSLDQGLGTPESCADPGMAGLEAFLSPACLALSPSEALLVVGTTGDDSLYFFTPSTLGSLEFLYTLPKDNFTLYGSLSDPVDLSFSPDGQTLFVLSKSSKTIFRLNRDTGTGHFIPIGAIKSGLDGVTGFDYPNRLDCNDDGSLLAVTGSGSKDGISLFSISPSDSLLYIGSFLPGDNLICPSKPLPLRFSPDGKNLVVGSTDEDSLTVFTR